MIHGTVLSILFARASSRAPADHGLANNDAAGGVAGLPGCKLEALSEPTWSSDGDKSGLENDNKYTAMKKVSLRAQVRNNTVCIDVS